MLGMVMRALFFGNLVDAVVVTLVLDPIGFTLTSLAHEILRRRPRLEFPALRLISLVMAASISTG
mgnify:CR=1 FL=1